MKKLLILILLLPSLAWGSDYARMSPNMLGSAVGGAVTACSASTDYVGIKATGAVTPASLVDDFIDCWKYTTTCDSGCTSGTFGDMYINHHDTGSEEITMCIYEGASGDSDPNGGSSNNKLGCAIIATSSDGDAHAAIDSTVTATCGATYWICVSGKTATWYIHKADTTTVWYRACTNCGENATAGADMPDPLSGSWSTDANSKLNMWVDIGP